MVTILKCVEGKCIWCCQTTETVEARFQDGLQGLFCKKDFWAALKARADGEPTPPSDAARPPRPV